VILDEEDPDHIDFKSFSNAKLILGETTHSLNNDYESNYFKLCQSYYHNEGIPEENIYSFSFALRPFYGHPSGMVDFSKVPTKILEISGELKGKFIHIFANGINVLSSKNGISSLKLNFT
jgi:hypothetical protein